VVKYIMAKSVECCICRKRENFFPSVKTKLKKKEDGYTVEDEEGQLERTDAFESIEFLANRKLYCAFVCGEKCKDTFETFGPNLEKDRLYVIVDFAEDDDEEITF
jgi:hypothetical protein